VSKSREYRALETLGPGTDPESWGVRMALAGIIVGDELQSSLGEKMELLPSGELEPLYKMKLERQAMAALPRQAGITITLTGDARTGALIIGGHPTPEKTKELVRLEEKYSNTRAAMDAAKATGADYVRCRACATNDRDTCQPLNGPDDMLCPCGKMREPYDCQGDEWMTKEGGR